jgi:hypothetical protein
MITAVGEKEKGLSMSLLWVLYQTFLRLEMLLSREEWDGDELIALTDELETCLEGWQAQGLVRLSPLLSVVN